MRPLFIDYLKSIYYSDDDNNQVAIAQTGLGALVKELLTKPPRDYKPKRYEPSECVELILPYYRDLNVMYNNYLSENSESIIRDWVKRKFYFDLREHIEYWQHINKMDINKAIILFCDSHQIHPDHYKVNSLYKDYYRSHEKKKTVKKMRKMSSTFSAVLS